MGYERDAARRYRDHAEKLRTIALCDGHWNTRETLLRIADDYDRMAATFDAIIETNRAVGKFMD